MYENPGILPFFKFGTPDAQYLASSGTARKQPNWRLKMTATNNFFAAAYSIAISAALFAYAIIPASPNLLA
jgi:hypothetical protein